VPPDRPRTFPGASCQTISVLLATGKGSRLAMTPQVASPAGGREELSPSGITVL
jgi:hypothetical protein